MKKNSLTVDLSRCTGKPRHVATGSLYGVTEEKPSDEMIGGIRPSVVRCSPEAGYQQPRGAAIPVAKRVAKFGTRVQLCFAEALVHWPYEFIGMEKWLAMVEATVKKVQAAGIHNLDGYEIFNEPDGTFSGQYIKPIDSNGNAYTLYKVHAGKAGDYRLTVRYANGEESDGKFKLTVNDSAEQIIFLPSTGGWFRAGAYGDAHAMVRLKEGYNEIKMSRASNHDVELDYVDIDGLTPKRYEAESAIRGYYLVFNIGYASSDKTDHVTFNELYYLTRKKIKELDPEAKIIGPSTSIYTRPSLRNFLKYQKERDSLPDIVCWHQLADEDITRICEDYRDLEKELGIKPIPITLNEYSGGKFMDEEGNPGACAPLIAKFERLHIDSALLSYWNNQGTLGSLVTVEGKPNGAYWFYKWYADMDGQMVLTIPEDAHNPRLLDGFACISEDKKEATVLLGGENEGSASVRIIGIPSCIGDKVKVILEYTPFENRETEVAAPVFAWEKMYDVHDGSIEVELQNLNNRAGYRIHLSTEA